MENPTTSNELSKVEKLLDRIEHEMKKKRTENFYSQPDKFVNYMNKTTELYTIISEEVLSFLDLIGLSEYMTTFQKLFRGLQQQIHSMLKFTLHYYNSKSLQVREAMITGRMPAHTPLVIDPKEKTQTPFAMKFQKNDTQPQAAQSQTPRERSQQPTGTINHPHLLSSPMSQVMHEGMGIASPIQRNVDLSNGFQIGSLKHIQTSYPGSARSLYDTQMQIRENEDDWDTYQQEYEKIRLEIDQILDAKENILSIQPTTLAINLKQVLRSLERTKKSTKIIVDESDPEDDDIDEATDFEKMVKNLLSACNGAQKKTFQKIIHHMEATRARGENLFQRDQATMPDPKMLEKDKRLVRKEFEAMLQQRQQEINFLKKRTETLEQDRDFAEEKHAKLLIEHSSCEQEKRDNSLRIITLEAEIASLKELIQEGRRTRAIRGGDVTSSRQPSPDQKTPATASQLTQEVNRKLLEQLQQYKNEVTALKAQITGETNKDKLSIKLSGANSPSEKSNNTSSTSAALLTTMGMQKQEKPATKGPAGAQKNNTPTGNKRGSIKPLAMGVTKQKNSVVEDKSLTIKEPPKEDLVSISERSQGKDDKTDSAAVSRHNSISKLHEPNLFTMNSRNSESRRSSSRNLLDGKKPMNMQSQFGNFSKKKSGESRQENDSESESAISQNKEHDHFETTSKKTEFTTHQTLRKVESRIKTSDDESISQATVKIGNPKEEVPDTPKTLVFDEHKKEKEKEGHHKKGESKVKIKEEKAYESKDTKTHEVKSTSHSKPKVKSHSKLDNSGELDEQTFRNTMNNKAKVVDNSERSKDNKEEETVREIKLELKETPVEQDSEADEEADDKMKTVEHSRYNEEKDHRAEVMDRGVQTEDFELYLRELNKKEEEVSRIKNELKEISNHHQKFSSTTGFQGINAAFGLGSKAGNKLSRGNSEAKLGGFVNNDSTKNRTKGGKNLLSSFDIKYKLSVNMLEDDKVPNQHRKIPDRLQLDLDNMSPDREEDLSPGGHSRKVDSSRIKHGSFVDKKMLDRFKTRSVTSFSPVKNLEELSSPQDDTQTTGMYKTMMAKAEQDPKVFTFLKNFVKEKGGIIEDESSFIPNFEIFSEYINELKLTHRKCGENCNHLQRFYARIGYYHIWNKRSPLTLKKSEIAPEAQSHRTNKKQNRLPNIPEKKVLKLGS